MEHNMKVYKMMLVTLKFSLVNNNIIINTLLSIWFLSSTNEGSLMYLTALISLFYKIMNNKNFNFIDLTKTRSKKLEILYS